MSDSTSSRQLRDYIGMLGLQYRAVAMRLRPGREYVFLGINPAGQWLFVEEATEQPIAGAIAQLLVDHDTAHDGGAGAAVAEAASPTVE